ncbi:(deoxy)nucleoside triphosphate pyrophosphohydrolase [Eremococcus coleocola]|nr:NUDIX domain-containing protein [Eremococcus coleocola]
MENNVAQRSRSMLLPELWEFPGGKIEASENPPQTLVRERKEELDLEFEVLDYINTADYGYNFGHLTLSTYTVKIIKGQSILKEHMASKWLAPDQVMDLNWAPVDVTAAEILSQNRDIGMKELNEAISTWKEAGIPNLFKEKGMIIKPKEETVGYCTIPSIILKNLSSQEKTTAELLLR